MRVLVAVHQLPPQEVGGVGLFSVHLASTLQQAGHQVTLLAGSEERSPDRPWVSEGQPAAPGLRTLWLRRPLRRGGFLAELVNPAVDTALQKAIHSEAPDVLHIQHTLQLSVRLAAMGRLAGAAVVASVHDYWPMCQRIVMRLPDGHQCDGPAGGIRCAGCASQSQAQKLLPRPLASLGRRALTALRLGPFLLRTQMVQGGYAGAHRITCPAPSVVKLMARAGFDAHKLMVVDYGIPPMPGVAGVPRPREPLRVGYLGTLGPHKGVLVALRALELDPRGGWELHVHGGPLRDEQLRQELERVGETGLAHYHGPYTEHQLPGILAGLDAVVIPSLWRETGPMVWMEAVAAGLPVVASRLGALVGRVHHGEDGVLFEAGDPRDLAAAVQRVRQDYPRFQQAVLERSVRTVEDAAREMLAVYQEAVADRDKKEMEN